MPAPDTMRTGLADEYPEPRTAVERQLAEIWGSVLGLGEVGLQDNFFELGGHSLLATQVISRIRSTLAVELPLRMVFKARNLAELAAHIQACPRPELPPLERTSREGRLPLSFAQRRLWFLDQMGTGEAYNMPFCLRLKGALHHDALRRAFEEIVKRHKPLRTTFASSDGEPHQVVHAMLAWELPLLNSTRS